MGTVISYNFWGAQNSAFRVFARVRWSLWGTLQSAKIGCFGENCRVIRTPQIVDPIGVFSFSQKGFWYFPDQNFPPPAVVDPLERCNETTTTMTPPLQYGH